MCAIHYSTRKAAKVTMAKVTTTATTTASDDDAPMVTAATEQLQPPAEHSKAALSREKLEAFKRRADKRGVVRSCSS